MRSTWNILIASGSLDNRKELIRVLDGLPVNVFVSHNLDEATQVLAQQRIDLVFCDAFLPDGTYRDLLPTPPISKAPIVVAAHSWDRDAHLEAMQHGAFGTLRCPLQPTDVELMVIRASHERERVEMLTEPYRMTA
jgi:DNA-binding NtrC family response regulator